MALLLGLRSKIRNAAATTIVANTIAIGFAALFLLGRRDAASDCWSALERWNCRAFISPAHEQKKTVLSELRARAG